MGQSKKIGIAFTIFGIISFCLFCFFISSFSNILGNFNEYFWLFLFSVILMIFGISLIPYGVSDIWKKQEYKIGIVGLILSTILMIYFIFLFKSFETNIYWDFFGPYFLIPMSLGIIAFSFGYISIKAAKTIDKFTIIGLSGLLITSLSSLFWFTYLMYNLFGFDFVLVDTYLVFAVITSVVIFLRKPLYEKISKFKKLDSKKKRIIIAVFILIVFISVFYLACQYFDKKQLYEPKNIEDVIITLERGPCYGTCPVYNLTIYGNGTVVYYGKYFVNVEGKQIGYLGSEKVRELISEFEKIDYFSLGNYEYVSMTDAEDVITSLTINGNTKMVRHYHGDFSAPQSLTELENKIDETVESSQWTGENYVSHQIQGLPLLELIIIGITSLFLVIYAAHSFWKRKK